MTENVAACSGSPTLRAEAAGDRAAIQALLVAAFGRPDEADLVDRLRAPFDGDALMVLELRPGALIAGEGATMIRYADAFGIA